LKADFYPKHRCCPLFNPLSLFLPPCSGENVYSCDCPLRIPSCNLQQDFLVKHA
jgi:hypothetical protein